MSNWRLAVAVIGVIIHTVGCCMLANRKNVAEEDIAGELMSIGFGIFAAVVIVIVAQ